MRKTLVRHIVLILVPCLLVDPVFAQPMAGRHGGLPLQFVFTSEALSESALFEPLSPLLKHTPGPQLKRDLPSELSILRRHRPSGSVYWAYSDAAVLNQLTPFEFELLEKIIS